MKSQPGKEATTIHILIEYNVGNVFLQKSLKKWSWETSSTPAFVSQKSFI